MIIIMKFKKNEKGLEKKVHAKFSKDDVTFTEAKKHKYIIINNVGEFDIYTSEKVIDVLTNVNYSGCANFYICPPDSEINDFIEEYDEICELSKTLKHGLKSFKEFMT